MLLPLCYKCQSPMEVRTAQRGSNPGTQFLGCSRYPHCRATLSLVKDGDDTNGSNRDGFTVLSEDEFHAKMPTPRQGGRISRAGDRVFRWLHRIHRRRLESDEPDATGEWEPKHRRAVLRYVYDRDGGRCGLCGAKTKIKGAQVEHIAPKMFATFNLDRGMVVSGSGFRSVLHKLDNLQAAHSYCNKGKGNSPQVRKWRHPDMPPLGVATTTTGSRLMVPAVDKESDLDDGLAPTKKAVQWWAVRAAFLALAALTTVWWLSPSGREVAATLTDWVAQWL